MTIIGVMMKTVARKMGRGCLHMDLLNNYASAYAFLSSVPPWAPSLPTTITGAGVHEGTKQREQNYWGGGRKKDAFPHRQRDTKETQVHTPSPCIANKISRIKTQAYS